MEIDTIKTVPLSEDTVLWFEFLLKPELLDEFLQNKPIHNAISLMSEFLGNFSYFSTEFTTNLTLNHRNLYTI